MTVSRVKRKIPSALQSLGRKSFTSAGSFSKLPAAQLGVQVFVKLFLIRRQYRPRGTP